ncbi:chromate efflux transporter [Futiania mangrovi]|uniref:Chromate efflux transporter n=1 Tax=Futiania mangrovi TaxID=2959716 RepID=A0A9J6PG10_9PROT|nr:chromate efflux transporter [Futiania mangrovii]MCP1337414.1 chromate efflux transporter [Futiania mangrovii]
MSDRNPPPPPPGFAEALRTWARIGVLSFGGPAGQIALMHRVLVEEKRWIGEARFLHALNFCMLLPGPEAQQLATYVGWMLHGVRGGLAAGLLFILPGAAVIAGLAALYLLHADQPLVAAAFLGVKAAVLAIVAQAVVRIGTRALKGPAAIAIAAAAFVAIHALGVPFPLIVLGAGALGLALGRMRPALLPVAAAEGAHTGAGRTRWSGTLRTALLWAAIWLAPVAILNAALGPANIYAEIARVFATLAAVSFGGAYAVLAYLAQAGVETHGWLSAAEMVDGLGLAETTPGPLILVTEFVGFLAAAREGIAGAPILGGLLGAGLTLWVMFAPSFLWIFALAPHVEGLRGRPILSAALAAITAAVVGVVANLALWFGSRVLFGEITQAGGVDVPVLASVDWTAAALSALALALVFVARRGVLTTLSLCAGAGIALAAM